VGGSARVFRAADGRVRLGWSLLLFFGIALPLAAAGGSLGLEGGASATLMASWVAGVVCLRLDGLGPGALGFYLARSVPRELARGTTLGVGLAVAVVGVLALSGAVRFVGEGGTAEGWLLGAVAAAALLALPAAAEEALLRGYPLQALTRAWGPGWGIGITSLAFGALHLPNPGVTWLGAANTAAAGVFLGVLYLRTGSLWWATAAHLGWNWGLGYLADLPVSGLNLVDAPLVQGVSRGPIWWGGGRFGPEGSVVTTLGLLGAAAICWWARWPPVEPAARARRPLALGPGNETDGAAAGTAPTHEQE
jgi:membrane protease YdiL (CAAX protease family)